MSAALLLPVSWGAANPEPAYRLGRRIAAQKAAPASPARAAVNSSEDEPDISLGFYRRHTESLLRRYLYASMQVGRAPSILGEPIARGWASSRPVRTFEDAVIFVLDIEKCINRLPLLDRQIISRIVLQEYTHAETAQILGMGDRTVGYKLPRALDRLTKHLLAAGLLVLPL